MATLDELKERVQAMLSTIDENNEFDESKDIDLIVDGIAAAHDAILPWISKRVSETIPSGTTIHPLPEDVYEIEAVLDTSNNTVYPRMLFEPGQIYGSNDYWFPYPTGSITFPEETNNDYELYYLTHWTVPEEESDLTGDMEPPAYCMTAMVYYAVAYVLLPDSVQSAEIRQWNVKADSGQPEHNPIEKSVIFLLKLFRNEMNSHPNYQRARS